MVCSYCNHRNAPSVPVCLECGVVLARPRVSKQRYSTVSRKSGAFTLFAVIIGFILGAVVGILISKHHGHASGLAIIIGTSLLGSAIATILFRLGMWNRANLNRLKHLSVQTKVKHSVTHLSHKYASEVAKPDSAMEARLRLAELELVQGEIEASVKDFQQAQKLGAESEGFFNNAGVALARRGTLDLAIDMFNKAIERRADCAEAHANLSRACLRLVRAGRSDLAGTATAEAHLAFQLKPEQRGFAYLQLFASLNASVTPMAVQQVEELVKKNTSDRRFVSDLYTDLGCAHFRAGDQAAALVAFRTAQRHDEGNARATSNIGMLLVTSGDVARALPILERSVTVDPHSAQIRSNLGYAHSIHGDPNSAIRRSREALLLDLNLLDANYNLAKIYADEGLNEIADRFTNRALQINGHCWQALTVSGVLNMRRSQYAYAINALTEAERLAPHEPTVLINMAVCLSKTFDFSAAEEYLSRVAKRNPKDHQPVGHLARINLLQDKISQAVDELTVAMVLDNSIAAYHHNYALCQLELGSHETAMKYFMRAIALDPQVKKSHFHLGYVYAKSDQLALAIKEWEIAAKREPGLAECFVNLGVAFYKTGNLEAAIAQFRLVIVIRQNRMSDFSNLGLAMAKQGMILRHESRKPNDAKFRLAKERHMLAVEMFDRALALDAKNAMLHSNRGLACFYANRPEESMEEWALVTRLDPVYARKRGAKQQSEFDDSAVQFQHLNVTERTEEIPSPIPDALYELSSGYGYDTWDIMTKDHDIAAIPQLQATVWDLERRLHASVL